MISLDTLSLAIHALDRDVARHTALAQDETLSDDDADYYSQYVLDLMKALSELGDLYEQERRNKPDFPSLDDLLKSQK